jgi:uncharacterized protein DUF4153
MAVGPFNFAVSDTGSNFVGQLSPDGRWRWDGAAWQPTAPRPEAGYPPWLNLRIKGVATPAMLVSAVSIGLLADQALRTGTFGIAAALTLAVAAMLLGTVGRINRTEPRLMLAASAVFALWLALRASPWLLWPDLAAAILLVGFAASTAAAGSMFDIGTAELIARTVRALAHISAGGPFIFRPIVVVRRHLTGLGPVARGLVIAIPICALLCVLLASADPVFASFFNVNFDLGQFAADIVFVAIGLLAMSGLFRLAAAEPIDRIEGPLWRLGATEALVVLALLDAVFTAFAIAQILAVTGAAQETLKSAGVSYSEYARSGFFQLLWAGGITLVTLILFSRITALAKPEHRVAFLVLSEIAIGLTLMIVIVAYRRLSLYEEAYGFTMLRLYSHIFAVWMALVFVLLATDLLGILSKRRWFVGATATSAVVVMLSLNFLNPEAVVVNLNVDHAKTTHRIDAEYLAGLSSDATPAILDSVGVLDPPLRESVASAACRGPKSYGPPLGAYNLSEAQSAAARHVKC